MIYDKLISEAKLLLLRCHDLKHRELQFVSILDFLNLNLHSNANI